MKKLIAALLLLTMVLSALVACANTDNGDNVTSGADTTTAISPADTNK